VDHVLLDIFKASKMKPLGEEAKNYCRADHLLERPFLKQLHQHSLEGRTCGYKSIAIHETPVGTLCLLCLLCSLFRFDSIYSVYYLTLIYLFIYLFLIHFEHKQSS
jgi:hypothetical protein